jgi:phosphoglycolate phosphatase-like HAD superfamily hydrolase
MLPGLNSWNDGGTRQAIEDFVRRVTTPGSPHFVRPEARVAVFDNDGTLWCEKPMPIELAFIFQRLATMACRDSALRHLQPWQAAYHRDYAWLGSVVTKHYLGDDSDVKTLVDGILKAFAGMSVEGYESAAEEFLRRAQHPTLNRRLSDCAYAPMIELLRFLELHGFTNYIISGGDRDFMRIVSDAIFGVPADRVVGSSNALGYADDNPFGSIAYLAKPAVFDDGPAKPVRIWSRIGRRPVLAVGNSNGDIQMLHYTGGLWRPAMRLVVLHDDAVREFDYLAGSERLLEMARTKGWNVVSMKNDWNTVFASPRVEAVAALQEARL